MDSLLQRCRGPRDWMLLPGLDYEKGLNPALGALSCSLSSTWALRKGNCPSVRKLHVQAWRKETRLSHNCIWEPWSRFFHPWLNLQMRPQSQLTWQTNCKLIRELKPTASSYDTPGFFTHRNCKIIRGRCLNPPSLGVIGYAAICNKYRERYKNKNKDNRS